MNFIHSDLGTRSKGEVVQISLTSGANVRLMNSSNFANYKNGRKHTYHGGLARKTPINLAIPSSGRWHLVVDMQGLQGSTKASVKVLPQALPEIQERSLREVPSLVRDNIPPSANVDKVTYDVFISHASEDKDEIVRSLAQSLQDKGLKVWFDEQTLRIGDSLRQKIDAGLANSKVGLVVLSPAFLKKGWTNYELDGIVTRAVSKEQIMLPIWHNITKQQVINFSPSLADKVARSTATHTIDEIAYEITDLIESKK